MNKKASSGQALLLLLLSMGAILTVVLSVASRSITDVSITSKDEESLRAFSAAEAGVERALIAPPSGGGTVSNEVDTSTQKPSSYAAVVTPNVPVNGYVYPVALSSGDTGTVWFVDHTSTGAIDNNCNGNTCYKGASIDVCWGRPGGQNVAIEVSVLYSAGGNLEIGRGAYDPDSVRRGSNRFSSPAIAGTTSTPCTIAGRTFAFQTTVNFSSLSSNLTAPVYNGNGAMKFMRVRLLYNTGEEFFGVRTLARDLPSQGQLVSSTGTAGNATRKVEVVNLYPEMPSIFDAALFSPPAIVK